MRPLALSCQRSLARCQTSGCRKPAAVLCRYPVTRHGRTRSCNRHLCAACASADRYCPPHARIAAESLVEICSVCHCASCAAGEDRCPHPGPSRRVTVAQWKSLLSFGVL